MVAPLLFVVSRAADGVNGFRFDANNWHKDRDPRTMTRPAGFVLHPEGGWSEGELAGDALRASCRTASGRANLCWNAALQARSGPCSGCRQELTVQDASNRGT